MPQNSKVEWLWIHHNTLSSSRVCSVIRELATRALHNLTPQAPDYMAATGKKKCQRTCSPDNRESCWLKRLLVDDFEPCNYCSWEDKCSCLRCRFQFCRSCCPWRWVLTSTVVTAPFWHVQRSHTLCTNWACRPTGRLTFWIFFFSPKYACRCFSSGACRIKTHLDIDLD